MQGHAGHGHPTTLQGPFYVVLEASSSDARSNAARLDAFLTAARAGGSGGVLGGSGDTEERREAAAHIWSVRKNLSEGLRLTGGGSPLDLKSLDTGLEKLDFVQPLCISAVLQYHGGVACLTNTAAGLQTVCSSTTSASRQGRCMRW